MVSQIASVFICWPTSQKKTSSIRCHSTAQTMTYNIVFWEKEALNQLWYTDDERQKRVCVCIKLVYYSDFVFSSSHLTLWFNKKTSYSIVFKVVNMLPCIVLNIHFLSYKLIQTYEINLTNKIQLPLHNHTHIYNNFWSFYSTQQLS